jgi:hypothetical protein
MLQWLVCVLRLGQPLAQVQAQVFSSRSARQGEL